MIPKHPKTIDGYLKGVGAEKRAALQRLRRAIKAAAPGAEECMAYGVPSFRLDGRYLLSFGAAAKHCSFYPGSRAIELHRAELGRYGLSKGTIRFKPEKPLPASLVRRLVKVRIGAVKRSKAP